MANGAGVVKYDDEHQKDVLNQVGASSSAAATVDTSKVLEDHGLAVGSAEFPVRENGSNSAAIVDEDDDEEESEGEYVKEEEDLSRKDMYLDTVSEHTKSRALRVMLIPQSDT
jgi:hypothetical protein